MKTEQSPYPNKSDEVLVREFIEGSKESFNELVRRYQSKMFTFIYYQIKHQQDSEDLTQEVFVQLHRKAQDFRNESGFTSFIYAIAKFIVLNYFRSQSRSIQQVSNFEPIGNEVFYHEEQPSTQKFCEKNPEQLSLQKTKVQTFIEALTMLSNEERQLLYLYDHENFTYQQISHILDIKVGTVRSRLHTCRQKLLNIMKGGTDGL